MVPKAPLLSQNDIGVNVVVSISSENFAMTKALAGKVVSPSVGVTAMTRGGIVSRGAVLGAVDDVLLQPLAHNTIRPDTIIKIVIPIARQDLAVKLTVTVLIARLLPTRLQMIFD